MAFIIALLFIFVPGSSFFQHNPAKAFSPASVNMVNIGHSLWMDKDEVTFLDWREFVYAVKNGKFLCSFTASELLPDTAGLKPLLCHPGLRRDDLPVVGVTKKMAEAYCLFRGWAIKQSFKVTLNPISLPTMAEVSGIKSKEDHEHCLHELRKDTRSIVNIYSNGDEWLSDGAIINGKAIKASISADKEMSFRCVLHY